MSTNNAVLVAIGLSLVSSIGWAVAAPREQTVAGDTQPRGPAASSADAAGSREQCLLLTSGQVIKGIVTKEGTDYVVEQHIGTIRFPKKRVEGAFASLGEAYKYRLAQLPDGDFDEHMKLALWCLNLNMKPEATEQLAKVVALCPNHQQARAMLRSMQQTEMLAAQRRRDPDVKQTAAGEVPDGQPGTLPAAVLQRAQRERMISTLPEIFDLPVPLAVRRANEFYSLVHPVLQAHCARCHDEHHNGAFQLVPIKNRADRTPDALRANLDATLRLIDPNNPSKSELLASTLRAHGHGPHPRPIFPGSNDRYYQILASWARNLRSNQAKQEPALNGRDRPAITEEEIFAAEHERTGGDPAGRREPEAGANVPPSPVATPMNTPGIIPPPMKYRGGVDLSARPIDADPRELEFPIPPALNGFKSPVAPRDGAAKQATASSKPATKAAGQTAKSANGSPAASGGKSAAVPASAATAPAKTSQPTKPDDDADAPKKPAKPVKIDPKLLEQMLKRQ